MIRKIGGNLFSCIMWSNFYFIICIIMQTKNRIKKTELKREVLVPILSCNRDTHYDFNVVYNLRSETLK